MAESLRAAVAATLEATARPAGPARERAAELVDEVVQLGRVAGQDLGRRREEAGAELARRRRELEGTVEDVSRRGQDVGGELVRRGHLAGEAIARRIGELIARPRSMPQGDVPPGRDSKPRAEG